MTIIVAVNRGLTLAGSLPVPLCLVPPMQRQVLGSGHMDQ